MSFSRRGVLDTVARQVRRHLTDAQAASLHATDGEIMLMHLQCAQSLLEGVIKILRPVDFQPFAKALAAAAEAAP